MSYIPILTLPDTIFLSPTLSILLPLTTGFAISSLTPVFAGPASRRHKTPPIQPPAYVFPIVWTILYALIGYAAHRAFVAGTTAPASSTLLSLNTDTVTDPLIRAENARIGATIYTLQLVLNFAFVPLFFWVKAPLAGVVDIVALDAVVVYLAGVWFEVDYWAGVCLVPYLSWLSFATYLAVETGKENDWDFGGGKLIDGGNGEGKKDL